MIEGFEQLDSTKVGRRIEKIVREYYLTILNGYSIKEDLDENYNTARDLVLLKDGRPVKIEIKGDNYIGNSYSNKIPFEFQQENMKGEMVDSGVRTTKSDLLATYCSRYDTIYVMKMSVFNHLLDIGTISRNDAKLCNDTSNTGQTMCYLVDLNNLEEGKCFEVIYPDFLKSLKKVGFIPKE
jgi:hypothetical protein